VRDMLVCGSALHAKCDEPANLNITRKVPEIADWFEGLPRDVALGWSHDSPACFHLDFAPRWKSEASATERDRYLAPINIGRLRIGE
jgi:hypothetical protein